MFGRQDFLLSTEERKANRVGNTMKRMGGYFGKYIFALLFVATFVLAGTYMQVLIPELTGQAVDCYLQPYAASEFAGGASDLLSQMPEGVSPMSEDSAANCTYTTVDPTATSEAVIRGLGGLMLLIVGLYVGNAVIGGIQFFLMSWAGFSALRDMRADVFQHVHRLSMSYFTKHEAGDVMSRFTNDVDTLQQVMGFGLVSVVQSAVLIIWIIYNMVTRSWSFALISLITLPLMFVATRWFSQQARRAFRVARQEIGSVNADLQESISAVREVQAFSREDENIEQFTASNAANRDANIRAQVFTSALAPALEALSYVSLAVVARRALAKRHDALPPRKMRLT
jgi:ATP-binding cassette subfamily B protein